MTSPSTSISVARYQTTDAVQEPPFAVVVGGAGGRPRDVSLADEATPREGAEASRGEPLTAPSHSSPALSLVISRLLAFTEHHGHRVIGLSSDRGGSGVSLLSRELARGYVALTRGVCLVDASRFGASGPGPDPTTGSAPLDLLEIARRHPDGYQSIDLSELPPGAKVGTSWFRDNLSPFLRDTDVVIVDLPPPCDPDGSTRTSAISIGAACDAVLLVCLTGVTTSDEFCRSLMQCRAGRMKVAGIVMNDWKLMGSSFI